MLAKSRRKASSSAFLGKGLGEGLKVKILSFKLRLLFQEPPSKLCRRLSRLSWHPPLQQLLPSWSSPTRCLLSSWSCPHHDRDLPILGSRVLSLSRGPNRSSGLDLRVAGVGQTQRKIDQAFPEYHPESSIWDFMWACAWIDSVYGENRPNFELYSCISFVTRQSSCSGVHDRPQCLRTLKTWPNED